MSTYSSAWDFIEKAGERLGATGEMRRKWRVRGVSHNWRLALVEEARRVRYRLDTAEFDRPPGPKRRCAATAAVEVRAQ